MEGPSESTLSSKDSVETELQTQNDAALKDSHDSGLFDWQSSKCDLRERFEHIFNKRLFCDVHFDVGAGSETKKISAHRLVLTAASVVFQTMFSEKWSEDCNIIEIPDVKPVIFEELLKFIYSDKVTLTAETVTEIMYTAKKYAVRALELKCADFLEEKLCPENAFTLLSHARFFDVGKLCSACLEVIGENATEALQTDEFCNIDAETLCLVLEQSNLRISEIDLFNAVVRWSKVACKEQDLPVNPENQRSVLKNAISMVRFPLMFPKDFATQVADSGLLSEKEMLAVFLHFVKESPSCDGFSTAHRNCVHSLNRFGGESGRGSYGSDQFQSIIFTADYAIQLFGFGLYGSPDASAEYDVTLKISNPLSFITQVWGEGSGVYDSSERKIYRVMLKKPIRLLPNYKYKVEVKIKGNYSLYGTQGKSEVTMNVPPNRKIKFNFFDPGQSSANIFNPTQISTGKTCVSSGQIPEILFGL